ncbi:MAG TPA: tetratricopeptide repeat protein [Vicinamibacterales bacterium]|nr:tetratricopeptide repeat protein [Vicinamibacterales bacterium]
MAKGKSHRRERPAARRPGAASTSRDRPHRRRAELYWVLAVGVAAVLVYVNAFGNEFVLDDTRIIRDNVRIRSLAHIPRFFTSSYWDLGGAQGLYRPLVLASYALNYAIHGLSTYGYTAVNIALHASVSILLVALVRAVGGSLFAAGVAGLAFAIHPVHTEAVTGIAGRPELLAALFFLLALHFHRRAPEAPRSATGYRVAAFVCFACALLSKESAMMLVAVLPIMDALFPVQQRDGRAAGPRARILSDYVPFVAVAAAYLVVRHAVLRGIVISTDVIAPLDNPLVPMTTLPLGERLGATTSQAIMTAFAVVTEYARLLVWPARLSPDYSYNQIPLVTGVLDGRFIAGVLLVAAGIGGILALWRRSPVAAFGLALLAVTFSIVSNFFVTIGTICAERLMYLPSAGVLIAAGVGAEWLTAIRPARRHIAYAILTIVVVMAAARTWTRNRDWKNDFALWSAAVEVAPQSARVQSEYGRVLMTLADDEAQAGRVADAERHYAAAQAHFEAALAIYPSYSPPMDGLATIHSLHQRFDEALVLYERAVKVWPGSYVSVTNWAGLLWDQSRRTAARASELRAEGKIAEADGLARQADAGFRDAIEKADRAITMMPSYAHAHLIRALLLDGYVGDHAGAIAEFEQVLRLAPNHPQRAVIEEELARLRARPPSGTADR